MEEETENWQRSAALLAGVMSQVLLLKDALDSGDHAAVVKAFALVSRVCGLEWLAAQAGCDRSLLFLALADNDRPDLDTLATVVDRLLRKCGYPGDGAGARFEG